MPTPPTALTIAVLPYSKAQAAIDTVRRDVFQQEQGVDPALDFDGQDEEALHVLVMIGRSTPAPAPHAPAISPTDSPPDAIGTARIRYLSPELVKLERVAVVSAYRGQGIGRQIMAAALDFLRAQNQRAATTGDSIVTAVKLNSQLQAKPFYEKLGFVQRGDVFEEAGIPHVEMWASL